METWYRFTWNRRTPMRVYDSLFFWWLVACLVIFVPAILVRLYIYIRKILLKTSVGYHRTAIESRVTSP
jgi:hypothetical protein